jgi:hypothetical protein
MQMVAWALQQQQQKRQQLPKKFLVTLQHQSPAALLNRKHQQVQGQQLMARPLQQQKGSRGTGRARVITGGAATAAGQTRSNLGLRGVTLTNTTTTATSSSKQSLKSSSRCRSTGLA